MKKNFFALPIIAMMFLNAVAADLLHIRTDEDYVKVLQRFFISRH